MAVVKGPWVKWWKRRLGWYADANNIQKPKGFDPTTLLWGDKAQALAVEVKKHAGISPANGNLDGALRKLLRPVKNPEAWTPKIVDIRYGRNGFPYNSTGSWGGNRSIENLFLVCHYTGGLGSLEADAEYHVSGHGWRNLSYHFAVDRDGTLYWSNDVDDLTWHARGLNLNGVGISFQGDASGPTAAQKKTLQWFIKKAITTGIPQFDMPKMKYVTSHRHAEYIDPAYSTDCPGDLGEIFYSTTAGSAFTTRPTG